MKKEKEFPGIEILRDRQEQKSTVIIVSISIITISLIAAIAMIL